MTYIIFYQDQRGGCHKKEITSTKIRGIDDIVFIESGLALDLGADCFVTGVVEVSE